MAGSDTHGDDTRYLELAREIQWEVARVTADGGAGAGALEAVFDDLTRRERARVASEVFARLAVTEQWAVLERVFGDDELVEALAGARAAVVDGARRRSRATDLVRAGRLDTLRVPAGERLALGLFREPDVEAGTRRGPGAASCARRLVVQATEEPGAFRVIEDVFNPDGGFFVTAAYDEATWRSSDRLPGHALVRLGTLGPGPDPGLEPALTLGGRLDVVVDGEARAGHLHVGWVRVGDLDVFSEAEGERWADG